ncbi:putative ABC transporter ATP-binding protein [Porphyridium purpureum]|uniref:Probable ATP-dependent transporter ycf16 n=1 Tax=Porphyridium purpureum TaxID=35688 RepID=A0A5J4Z620_PORPP|nr:putative ABC transporter ATP-binding protein [Porphyridium purpureum]|eukprot:POR4274..scf295_1
MAFHEQAAFAHSPAFTARRERWYARRLLPIQYQKRAPAPRYGLGSKVIRRSANEDKARGDQPRTIRGFRDLWRWWLGKETRPAPEPYVDEITKQPALLELRQVQYQVRGVLDDYLFHELDLKIFPNELVVLIGANGCGKSTLLKLCGGYAEPLEGWIYFSGEQVKSTAELRGKVGTVLQEPGRAFFTNTVLEELCFCRSVTPANVRAVLEAVGLSNISLRADPRRLSGGQQRRLALANQLCRESRPQLLLLDEPLVGIDFRTRREMVALFAQLKQFKSMVIVSHEPGEILLCADRVVQIARRGIMEVDKRTVQRAIAVRKARNEYEEGAEEIAR